MTSLRLRLTGRAISEQHVGLPQSMRTGLVGLDQAINELTAVVALLYVVAGPVMSHQSTGRSSESRADAFYKVVSDGQRVAAFLFDKLPPTLISALRSVLLRLRVKFLWHFPDAELDDDELVAALGCSQRRVWLHDGESP